MTYTFQSIQNQALATLVLLLAAFIGQAQNPFPTSGFTLPNGKTIVISYEVTVNANACPTGTAPAANISNQSNVSGSNFATVQTYETNMASPDPTLTPFGGLTLGNLVYKDVNKDGDYDAGTDTPIDGVNLRLYLDDGDGVLDAGDGAHIATATTASGGLYSFNVCPGNYIVEVIPSNFNSGGALYDNALSAGLISSPVGGAPDPDNDVDNDDNGDPVSGFGVASQAITMAYGAEPNGADLNTNNTLDFGFQTPTTVTIGDRTLAEGTGGGPTAFNFTVTRSDNNAAFSLTVNTAGGTATSGTDFTAISGGTVSFTAGGNLMETVTVNVTHDNIVEADETFTVVLSGPPNGIALSDDTGLGTINNDDVAVVTLTGGTSQNEGTSFVFTATLNNPVQGGFTIAYATNDGTTNPATTADNDYTDNDGPALSFAGTAGEMKTITVNTSTDNKVELDETFTVTLGSITGAPAGVTAAGSPQTGTITNDDAATVSIAANVSQSEATTPQAFSVTLSNPVDVNVTVNFNTANNTATTGDNDYTGILNQLVTFNAGTTTSQTVNVAVTNDNKVEADEIFDVSIGTLAAGGRNVSLGTSARTGTILNNDAATVTLKPVAGVTQNEGNSGTTNFVFTAELDNPVQGGFTVPYTTNDGLATTANNDYQDNDGTLTFAGTMGEANTITVLVNGDFIVEANEGFTVALGAISGAPAGVSVAGSPKSGLIVNDEIDFGDAPDSYGTLLANNGARHLTSLIVKLGATVDGDADGQPGVLADGDDTDAEGDDDDGVTLPSALVLNTTANISLEASMNGSVNGWVDFNIDGDFTDPGELVFNQQAVVAGANALSFAVPAGATAGSSYARFRFTQGAVPTVPTGLQTTGEVEDYQVNIVNTQFSIDDPMVTEGNSPNTSNLTFRISRSVNANACSVQYGITGGTATSGTDYQAFANGTASFTAGGAFSQTITVTVIGDNTVELNETVLMMLNTPVNASILDGSGSGEITNDDQGIITISNATVTEGDAGTVNATFDITMSNPSDANVVFGFSAQDGTATFVNQDYQATGSTHTLTPGQTMKQVMVPVVGDCAIEPNETFFMRLASLNPTGRNVIFSGSGATLDGTGIITNDDALPVITCPGEFSQNAGANTCFAQVTIPLPTTSSVCGSSSLDWRARTVDANNVPLQSFSSFQPSNNNIINAQVGRFEVEWRVTDGSGASTCNFYFNVVDNQPPTISCPMSQTQSANSGQCSAVATYATPTAMDNCTGATVMRTSGLVSGSAFPVGINTVIWKVTDGAGLTVTCSFSITVTDNQIPSITCPANAVRSTDPGLCSAVTTYASPTFSDNCSGVSIQRTAGPASGSAFLLGQTMVEWKATDASGNMSICQFTVTVVDAQLPGITCPSNIVLNTDAGLCTAVVTYANPTAADNCAGVTVVRTSAANTASGSAFPKGPTTVTWEARDAASPANTKSCSFVVTVNDNQLPSITCPANQAKGTDLNVCTAAVAYANPSATDNCTPPPTVTIQSGLPSGSAFPKGITVVTWKATDGAGLTKTCTFRVTVNDTQAPTISCPASQSLNTDANLCSAVATYTTPTGADNCTPPPTVVKMSGLASGSAFPKGSSTVVWKATDGAGLTKTCSFTVTVTDAQLPTITCPNNIAVTGSGPSCSATVTYPNPTATDHCGIASNILLSGLASGSTFPQGVTTNVWRATDNSGLTKTCAFTVTVACGASANSSKFEVRSLMFESGMGLSNLSHLELRIAPNPVTTGEVTVTVEGLGERGGELLVFDPLGRMVLRQMLAAGQRTAKLNVGGAAFSSGLYQVSLRAENGTVTKTLVVSR